MKKWFILIAALAALAYQQFFPAEQNGQVTQHSAQSQTRQPPQDYADQRSAERILQQAYEQKQSDVQVQGSGKVIKTLPDDNKGSRHQRFILKLSSGQTLLVAHNIDLAEKIKGLKKGDTVSFYGEYEWTEQGGVIHWTHHDPRGNHVDGWLEHNGKRYQ
ncbi:DUF3465 domain-containing protein [Neisseria animalis]|uniref:DUF3465 domain-containing protein n=1 Tax=Neisseria animalis TaxID=492 RepID=A0A5P3MRQ5_NEIAN|nr:DUF3465 domain-containing protein [Neisseria animalis]QEY24264.1 DUF3465 domain-containing protein [Neisseria animalis]ROW32330.1 DUF3465 domain-containing protein [Neisseria animalis]VEE06649.1 Protein of uncharacterised function (DUF3465) [Neisseria animalis]